MRERLAVCVHACACVCMGLRGCGMLRPDRAATLVACSETTSLLAPRQVYVVRGGVALTGTLVVTDMNSTGAHVMRCVWHGRVCALPVCKADVADSVLLLRHGVTLATASWTCKFTKLWPHLSSLLWLITLSPTVTRERETLSWQVRRDVVKLYETWMFKSSPVDAFLKCCACCCRWRSRRRSRPHQLLEEIGRAREAYPAQCVPPGACAEAL